MKIIMLKGIQGSGKSTWAKNYLKDKFDIVRVSNDELRLMMFNRVFSKRDSHFISIIREMIIEKAMVEGKDIIVDNMNITIDFEMKYRILAEKYGYEFEIKEFTDVPLEVCIERDSKRINPIGVKIITDVYNKFIKK